MSGVARFWAKAKFGRAEVATAAKVLLIALHRSPYLGGLERAFLSLLDGIPRDEFEIVVALMPGMEGSLFGQEVSKRDVRIITMEDVLQKTDLAGMAAMVRSIRREKPAIVHIHLTHPLANPFLQIAAFIAQVPVLIATEQTNVLIQQRAFGRRRKQFTGRITDVSVAVSEATRRGLVKYYGLSASKIIVIPNGVAAHSIAGHLVPDKDALRRKLGASEDDYLIGTVAALRDQKGHTYLLQAFAQVQAQFPRTRLLLVGDGALRQTLEHKAHELGVADRVLWAGWRSDVWSVLHVLDLFVLPSLWEGLPLAVLEAMAAARPIVASAVDGTAEVIHDQVEGLLVPPADATALAEAILRVCKEPGLSSRLGAAARERAKCFDESVMARRYVDLYYQQLAKRKNSKA